MRFGRQVDIFRMSGVRDQRLPPQMLLHCGRRGRQTEAVYQRSMRRSLKLSEAHVRYSRRHGSLSIYGQRRQGPSTGHHQGVSSLKPLFRSLTSGNSIEDHRS